MYRIKKIMNEAELNDITHISTNGTYLIYSDYHKRLIYDLNDWSVVLILSEKDITTTFITEDEKYVVYIAGSQPTLIIREIKTGEMKKKYKISAPKFNCQDGRIFQVNEKIYVFEMVEFNTRISIIDSMTWEKMSEVFLGDILLDGVQCFPDKGVCYFTGEYQRGTFDGKKAVITFDIVSDRIENIDIKKKHSFYWLKIDDNQWCYLQWYLLTQGLFGFNENKTKKLKGGIDTITLMYQPGKIAYEKNGNLFLADISNNCIIAEEEIKLDDIMGGKTMEAVFWNKDKYLVINSVERGAYLYERQEV